MHKKFEINWIKIKGSCQSGSKAVYQDSKSDFPLCIFFAGNKPLDTKGPD